MLGIRQARMLALFGGALLLLVLLLPPPVQAATAPPAVSNIRLTLRTDHRLGITWDVPAVYYSPGVHGVVRITRGYTPAASPTAGYAVPVWNRTAETPSCLPFLTPDVVYTLAVWVNDHGTYSARRSISVRTLKDTTPAMGFGLTSKQSSIAEDGHVQVLLIRELECEEYSGFRIIRNTRQTLTGATAWWVPGNGHAFLDHGIPGLKPTTDQRIYYWIIGRDRAGNWGQHYMAFVMAFGNRFVSGHVSGTRNVQLTIACCPDNDDGSPKWRASVVVSPGDFTLAVPAGWYGLCAVTLGAATAQEADPRCWIKRNGVYSAESRDYDAPGSFPTHEIDLVNAPTFSDVAF